MSTTASGGAGERRAARPACRMCGADALRDAGVVRGYAFAECGACGFAFAPQVTQASMEARYAAGYHGPDEGVPAGGWTGGGTEFLAPALERLGPGPLAVLDFGTGESLVPDALRARGHRVVAVDVSPPRRPHPDRLTGSLLSLGLPADGFDLAFSFQTFEHLPEPRPFLDRLLGLVRPGGLVLVHTDMETPERGDDLAAWWYVLPPDHCSLFRPRTFAAALRGSPHRLVWHDAKRVLLEVGEEGAGRGGHAACHRSRQVPWTSSYLEVLGSFGA